MPTPFVLNDETIKNSHGFYLLNSGGQFERFDANPVMLDNHDSNRLIGRWANRRIEGARLIADPDFDDQTPLGAERKGQVERGFLKGASLGLMIVRAELIADEVYVTEWEAVEASTTPIPSNAGALSLKIYDEQRRLVADRNIKAHVEGIVRLCAAPQEQNNPTINPKTMEKTTIQLTAEALTALGVASTDAIESTVLSASITALAAERDQYKTKVETQAQKAAEELIDLAIKTGKATADKRESLVQFALAQPEAAKAAFDGIAPKASLAAHVTPIGTQTGIPAGREKWTTLQWLREDPKELNRIRQEEPDIFEAIKAQGR